MTTDLRPKWLNVTRSLQKAACRNNGIAIISARVVVDAGGDPVTWTEPDVTKLGPLSSQDDLIKLLAANASISTRAEEYLLAQVLDSQRLVINKGIQDGVVKSDWFMYIDNDRPYAMLSVSELRDRITILQTVWVGEQKNIIKLGTPLHRIYW